MKNIQIIFLAFVTLSLFACDSSSTPQKTGGGAETYSVDVKVFGLNGTVVMMNVLTNEERTFTADSTRTLSTGLADKADYDVKVKTQPTNQNCKVTAGVDKINAIGVIIDVTCSDIIKLGSASAGKQYYTDNCGVCHNAGVDTTSAFSSQSTMDLAKHYRTRITNGLVEKIKPDMHDLSIVANLMGDFQALTDIEVADLIAYLKSLP